MNGNSSLPDKPGIPSHTARHNRCASRSRLHTIEALSRCAHGHLRILTKVNSALGLAGTHQTIAVVRARARPTAAGAGLTTSSVAKNSTPSFGAFRWNARVCPTLVAVEHSLARRADKLTTANVVR